MKLLTRPKSIFPSISRFILMTVFVKKMDFWYNKLIMIFKIEKKVNILTVTDLNNGQIKELAEEAYAGNLDDLKKIAELIEIAMKKQIYEILEKDNSYKLKHNIGVSGGYYFKLSSRVKTVESLGEKLVRKSDLLKLKNLLKQKELPNEKSAKIAINEYLDDRYGDLIGVKILGDLSQDESNIYQLLKNNKDLFEDTQYEIIFKNIEDNHPERMQNGLDIYKIDCIYIKKGIGKGAEYKFELQIKSQLMSAWADMEHQHYYKNHLFNPVKFTNQPVMNEVGKLLKQTESILIKIRNSEDDYKKIEDELAFTGEICEMFGRYIRNVLEVNPEPMLTNTAQTLYKLSKIIPTKKEEVEKVIASEFVGDITCVNVEFEKYRELVSQNFSLQILEYIIGVWYKSKGIDNQGCFSERLHNDLTRAIIKFTQLEESYTEFSEIINEVFKKLIDSNVYLNLSKFDDISNLFKYLKDESNNTSVLEKVELDDLIGKDEEELEMESNAIDPYLKNLCIIYAEILYSDINSIDSKKISKKYNLGENKKKLIGIINAFYATYSPELNNELEKFLEVIKGNEEV